MRTNVDIDDELMTKALALSGLPTKKAVVEEALKMFIETAGQIAAIKNLAGMGWDGMVIWTRSAASGRDPDRQLRLDQSHTGHCHAKRSEAEVH